MEFLPSVNERFLRGKDELQEFMICRISRWSDFDPACRCRDRSQPASCSTQYINQGTAQIWEIKPEAGLKGFLRNDPLAVQDE